MKNVKEKSVTEFSSDCFNRLLLNDEPFVITGLCQQWPLTQLNTPTEIEKYLLSFDQGHPIGAFIADKNSQGRYFYNDDLTGFNFERKRTTLAKALQQLKQHNDDQSVYVGSANLQQLLPGFLQYHQLEILNDRSAVGSIWISNQSRIGAHHDEPHNIVCNAIGSRTITLFPPEQIDNLYIGPLDMTPAGQAVSLVDFHAPDYYKFPRFKRALDAAYKVQLSPGDCLFIPSLWWHHVEATESFNVMVNFWWREKNTNAGSPMDALSLALMNINQLSDTEKKNWKMLFDYYVFDSNDETFAHIPRKQQGILDKHNKSAHRQLRAKLQNTLNR